MKLKGFKSFLIEGKLEQHPLNKMREYTDSEFPWEYREYTKYTKNVFPKAFDSQEHFKKKYDEAPLVHLKEPDLHSLDYSTVGSYMGSMPKDDKIDLAHAEFSHRRDVDRIQHDLLNGKTAPPIVLKHSKGLRILGGNTRLSLAAAHNINLPVKLIDITDI